MMDSWIYGLQIDSQENAFAHEVLWEPLYRDKKIRVENKESFKIQVLAEKLE